MDQTNNNFIKYKNYYIHRYRKMPSKMIYRIGEFIPDMEQIEDNFICVYSTNRLCDAKRYIDKGYIDEEIKMLYKKYTILYNVCIL